MSNLTLTKTRLFQGVWEGVVHSAQEATPNIQATLLDKPISGVSIDKIDGNEGWSLRVPIPVDAINDGIQTFLINDASTGETLNSFALLSGEALGDDIRAEVELLRAELDMLKRAFRRHCLETVSG